MLHRKTFMALALSALALSACAPSPNSGGRDADRRVIITNETGHTIKHFYGSRASTDSWEEDILAGDPLRNRQQVLIDFDDGSDDCIFDMRAELADGSDTEKYGIDVCRVSEVTFN